MYYMMVYSLWRAALLLNKGNSITLASSAVGLPTVALMDLTSSRYLLNAVTRASPMTRPYDGLISSILT